MDRHRWQRIEELYHSALDRPFDVRSRFLLEACAGDLDLLREVQELIAHDQDSNSVVDRPAWERVAGVVNTPELEGGTHLGPYRIERLLGAGGMGYVYRATDTRLGRAVAIKLLREEQAPAALRLRFQREAQAISSLNHPNICALYDVGTFSGASYLVMECVEGETLARVLERGPLQLETAIHIALGIVEGLAAAHTKGVIHRDLKPSNVMVTESGVKILDFGLSRTVAASLSDGAPTLTMDGAVMGTPAYMSPEQFTGIDVDTRSDIFSYGLVLYEMFTGKRAFSGSTALQIMTAIMRDMPPAPRTLNPQIPPALEQIILKCIQKAPQGRYQTAKEVASELKEISSTGGRVAHRPARRHFLIAVCAILAILTSALLWRFSPILAPRRIKSIAVLPLDNLSGDPTQDFFADGMTEVLITDLGKIGSLRVISRPSVMKYRGSRATLRDVAGELKVDALVVGSIARAEGKVRITTQLYDAADDRQLWAENYERDIRDVIALQREVARAITTGIRAKVTPEETARLTKVRRVNPKAYDGYLRAVLLYSRHTSSDNNAAITTLDETLALDQDLAAAHALLAAACVERFFTFAPQEQKKLEEKAYVAVEKAIALDPEESMAWFARGRLIWTPGNRFPHERAIREYQRALALNPNSSEARAQLALTYNHVGLLEDALREARAAADINPIDALPRVVIGQALLYGGQYARALSVWSTNPPEAYSSVTGSHTAWTLFQMGRKEEAAARTAEFLAKYPGDVGGLGVQAVLLAASGRHGEAEAVIRRIAGQKGFGHFHHTAYYIACAYARMGNGSAAFEWIREAADSGFACYPLFERDPNFETLHNDPRWRSMISEFRQTWDGYRKFTSERM
jgi:eukaryotic-like serine/threonine-protein kinase